MSSRDAHVNTPGRPVSDHDHRSDLRWCVSIFAGALLVFACWSSGELSSLADFGHWLPVGDSRPLQILGWFFSWGARSPASTGLRVAMPTLTLWRTMCVIEILFVVGGGFVLRTIVGRFAGRHSTTISTTARWADQRSLSSLVVSSAQKGRVILGRMGRRLIAMERHHSILVVGPTQSGKTSGFVIPAILEWEGPVVATSVKTDLVRDTFAWRSSVGDVALYDPSGVSGFACDDWSPLLMSSSWSGAKNAASGLCSVARSSSSGLDDAAFWYATAEKLLAPLLFAAATSGATMSDVLRWVDTEEVDEVIDALDKAGVAQAKQAAFASFRRDDRQRSSVYTTTETILAAFTVDAPSPGTGRQIDPESLVDGQARTLYLVAPTHEQERLQSAFVALLRSVLEAAYTKSSRTGRPLDPPLLVVLDEAANIAPLHGLDSVASVAASHGVQLLTVWQDMAQITARYGARSTTVVNNHRAKLLCSGLTDQTTLDQVSALIGDEDHAVKSSSVDRAGSWTTTTSQATRRLAPADWLRRIAPNEAILLYGHLAPARLRLRPFYSDTQLARRSELPLANDYIQGSSANTLM